MRLRFTSSAIFLAATLNAVACGGGSSDAPPSTGGSAGSAGTGGSAGNAGSSGSAGNAGSSGSAGNAGTGGSDGGLVTECPPDADGDNIPDSDEARASNRDTDGDGTADYLDDDSDADGVPDRVERGDANLVGCNIVLDSDNDGKANAVDKDSDGNGIEDGKELYPDGSAYDSSKPVSDLDGDGLADFMDDDDDDDSFRDVEELVAGRAVDTDRDGFGDHQDEDSDGDTIGDRYETYADRDRDGTPNLRDLDSDADTVGDACEAGFQHQLSQPPANTDNDASFDFLDVDADNDGLRDGLEDKNKDCVLNSGETSRVQSDTDGDGASDLIEVSLESDPADDAVTPGSLGKYYFVLPYSAPAQPPVQDVVLGTNFNKGDIGFIIDSTGTMAGAISNVRTSVTQIVTAIRGEFTDARFGVLGAEEYPVDPYGGAENRPVKFVGPEALLGNDQAKFLTAITALSNQIANGGDAPEAQVAAMYRALKNTPLSWPASGPTFPAGTLDAFTTAGGYGGLGFRTDALPVLVLITDAPFHNGRYFDAPNVVHDPYSFNGPSSAAPPDVATLVTEMNRVGAKFVGVALDGGGPARTTKNPYRDMAYIADRTGSVALPQDAFGTTDCRTDIAGLGLPPDYTNPSIPTLPPTLPPKCRLIFSGYADGRGTSDGIRQGIRALLRGIRVTVRVAAVSVLDPPLACGGSLVDAVDDFVDTIEVNAQGAIEDPSAIGKFCESLNPNDLRDEWDGPTGVINTPDGTNETATDVRTGDRVCFAVTAKQNRRCTQKDDVQVARAQLIVYAKSPLQPNELPVGEPRDVFFVVPPVFQ